MDMRRIVHGRRNRFLLALTLATVTLVSAGPAAGSDDVKHEVAMTCFPAPGAPATPPCLVPAGLDPATLDGTSGELELKLRSDGTTKVGR